MSDCSCTVTIRHHKVEQGSISVSAVSRYVLWVHIYTFICHRMIVCVVVRHKITFKYPTHQFVTYWTISRLIIGWGLILHYNQLHAVTFLHHFWYRFDAAVSTHDFLYCKPEPVAKNSINNIFTFILFRPSSRAASSWWYHDYRWSLCVTSSTWYILIISCTWKYSSWAARMILNTRNHTTSSTIVVQVILWLCMQTLIVHTSSCVTTFTTSSKSYNIKFECYLLEIL